MAVWLKALSFYVEAILRHWFALMSGVVSLGVALTSTFGYIEPGAATNPKLWYALSVIGFFWATFLAWKDEYDTRRVLEQTGPQLSLECLKEAAIRWYITNNSNDVDALNITSEDIVIGRAGTRIDRVQSIGRGESAQIEFEQWFYGGPLGHASHPSVVFDREVRREAESRFVDAALVEALGDWVIPVHLNYQDPAGARFHSVMKIHWNAVLHYGYVEPISWERLVLKKPSVFSRIKHWFRYLPTDRGHNI